MSSRKYNLTAMGLVLLLFALLSLGARQMSLTADEPTYTACGYALLARGRQVFPILTQRGYPPLLIGIEALPLYLTNPDIPVMQLPGWPTEYAPFLEAFKPYLAPVARTKTMARLPIIMLTTTLGAVIFRWGKDLWGDKAGLLALVALTFDPLLLAHGRLANSDAGTVALGTASLYVTWRWAKNPSWRRAAGWGVLLGLTMLAKASGVLWTISAGMIVLGAILAEQRGRRDATKLEQGAVAIGLSLFILWAGYGFDWGTMRGFPIPVPAPTHWKSLLYLDKSTDLFFALGQRSYSGWWWYFPLAFLIKNPLPLLVGWVVGVMVFLRRSPSVLCLLALGFFPSLYTGVAIWEKFNLGYRYMLPVHPFLYLMTGQGLGQLAWGKRSRLGKWASIFLGAWYIIAAIHIFPHEISYFNELVGGPAHGYRYLSDSNVDWGQSSDAMRAYLREHPDVKSRPPTFQFHPAPGRYLVGASYLQGIGTGDRNAYEWFRHCAPQDIVDYSLLVYQSPPFGMEWVAQCEKPVVPLDYDSILAGTGRTNLRDVTFDCTELWLYPNGGATDGIYALHQDMIGKPHLCFPSFLFCRAARDPFVARHLARARLSFEQSNNSQSPSFALYEMTAATVKPSPVITDVYVTSGGRPVPGEQITALSEGPIALNGPLVFLGAEAYLEKETWEIETWWRVTDGPITRPFSIMAHLLSSDEGNTQVSDGLGVSPAALSAGDVIVQRHRFSPLRAGSDAWLLTGAYWLDTMERWSVDGAPVGDTISIHLDGTQVSTSTSGIWQGCSIPTPPAERRQTQMAQIRYKRRSSLGKPSAT